MRIPQHLLFVLLLANYFASGCSATESAPDAQTASALTEDGPLLVSADVGFAPHAMIRPDGVPEGFNIDLAEEFARRLGRPGYEIVDQEWSGMFAGLNANRFEFIIAPTTMTYERSQEVLFVEGYLDTDYTFLIQNDAPEIMTLENIRRKAIAVNNGSAYDLWAMVPPQPIDATQALNRSAGVSNSSVLRGRSLSSRATLFRCACECTDKSVLFGKYCRSRPFVFSLEPRCHGLCGSQK